MKHKFILLLIGLLFLFLSPSGAAASYIVSSVTATVDGGDMEGLRATVLFDDGSSSTADWLPDSPTSTSGAAENTVFSLSITGNTYYTPWLLENYAGSPNTSNIVSMTLEGLYNFPYPRIVFDIVAAPQQTVGSQLGGYNMDLPYSSREDGLPDAVMERFSYSDAVYVQGEPPPPEQDLFATATVTFSGDGLAPGGTFFFLLDTDRVEAVPIPGAFLLLGSGLLCLIGIRRRAQ